jgi:hypothetical protein
MSEEGRLERQLMQKRAWREQLEQQLKTQNPAPAEAETGINQKMAIHQARKV